jgi:hypothetical protein
MAVNLRSLLRVRETDGITDDILLLGVEDVSTPERPGGEEHEDDVGDAEQDDHNQVQGKERLDLEGVAEHTHGGDPAD